MSPSLAVILLNYRRPQNIGRIVRAARQALPAAPIFILDQGGRADFRARNDIEWSAVWLQSAATNRGAGARIPLAAGLGFDHYLAIDDDVFLTPGQIAGLAARLAAEPDQAHGVGGQRLEMDQGSVRLSNSMACFDGQVSVLNRIYAFTRAQAAAAIALAARLGFASWDHIGPADDVLLSCAGARPAMCHNLGSIAECPTSGEAGVAVWKSEGFDEHRAEVMSKLLASRSIAVFSPLRFRE